MLLCARTTHAIFTGLFRFCDGDSSASSYSTVQAHRKRRQPHGHQCMCPYRFGLELAVRLSYTHTGLSIFLLCSTFFLLCMMILLLRNTRMIIE